MRVSVQDKLRTLLAATIGGDRVYTQVELAEQFGISTRTLRRFKNQKGYRLARRTEEKIKAEVSAENRRFRRDIKDRAWDAKARRLVKSPRLRLPTLPVQPVPTLYKAKSGLSQTLKIDCSLWSTQQKIDYLISAANSGRFYSWTARVSVKNYLIRKLIEEYGSIENVPLERLRDAAHEFYMIGPFSLQSFSRTGIHGVRKKIESEITHHEDAGRIVVSISIVENLPGTSK